MTTTSVRQGGTNDDEGDGGLVRRTLEGDHRAFESLVRRYERLVFHIAGGFLRDRRDVDEVAQDAFMRAFEALSRFRQEAPFGPWISQITTRLCYDRLRARQRQQQDVAWDELSPAEQNAARGLAKGGRADESAANRDLAERALGSLPAKDRQVLVSVEVLGYSAAEAAQMLGCSALAVRIRLSRARRAMRAAAERLLDGMAQRE